MVKRDVYLVMAILLTLTISVTALAKPKAKGGPGKASQTFSEVDLNFLAGVFKFSKEEVSTYGRYELSIEELSLVFYLYSAAGRPFSEAELAVIAREKKNWEEWAWRFGLPPVIPEEGLFQLQRPWHPRILPPLEKKEYHQTAQGEYEEVIKIKPNKYEYLYTHKRLGIIEVIKVSRSKYEYRYSDPLIEERLEINLRNLKYEYRYKERTSGREIKRKGVGRRLVPELLYRQLRQERAKDPHFSLSIQISIHF